MLSGNPISILLYICVCVWHMSVVYRHTYIFGVIIEPENEICVVYRCLYSIESCATLNDIEHLHTYLTTNELFSSAGNQMQSDENRQLRMNRQTMKWICLDVFYGRSERERLVLREEASEDKNRNTKQNRRIVSSLFKKNQERTHTKNHFFTYALYIH